MRKFIMLSLVGLGLISLECRGKEMQPAGKMLSLPK